MSYPSFVLQAAKLSWLTATEGSFGSASWIKAETFVSASTTWFDFKPDGQHNLKGVMYIKTIKTTGRGSETDENLRTKVLLPPRPFIHNNCQKQDSSKTVAADHNFHVECNGLKIVYSSMAPCSSEDQLCPPQDCRPQPGTKTKHLLRASRVEQKWTCDAFKLHTDSYCSSMLYWECGNHIWRFRLDLNLQSLSCFNVK